MRFRLAVLAEFAQHTQSGALNVLGIFEHLWFERFPNDYLFFVVLSVSAGAEHFETRHHGKVTLIDPDGNQLSSAELWLAFARPKYAARSICNGWAPIAAPFAGPGEYEVRVEVGDEVSTTIPLTIIERARPEG